MDLTSIEHAMLQFEVTLEGLYTQMLTLTGSFVNLGRAIGGIGALLYISSRLWGHLARAEPIDFYPLLRPFAIGLCILLFPQLCQTLRGATMAVSHSTDTLRAQQIKEILTLSKTVDAAKAKAKEKGVGDFHRDSAMDTAVKILQPGGVGDMVGSYVADTTGDYIREGMKDFLQLANVVARLALSLMSTLLLTLLSIAGPLAFGIAIFPGFGGGVAKWFGNFVTISLWVPVANIFGMGLGQVQIWMLTGNINQLAEGTNTDAADTGLLVFLALSTIAYMLVPMATDKLVAAVSGGVSGGAAMLMAPVSMAAGAAGAASGAGLRGVAGGIAGTPPPPAARWDTWATVPVRPCVIASVAGPELFISLLMNRDSIIIWLNSLFPSLPRWQEWLLVVAAVLSVLSALDNYAAFGLWSTALGGIWLRLLWRPVPPPGSERRWWVYGCCITGLILVLPLYLRLLQLLHLF